MREILEGPKAVIGGFLTIVAVVFVLYIVGIVSTPGANSAPFMTAVGDGIKWIFTQLALLVKAL